MKVLFTHRYFVPDSPPYGLMLKILAQGIVERDGYDVHVFSAMPSYRDELNGYVAKHEDVKGVTVRRCRVFGTEKAGAAIRVLNTIAYCVAMFMYVVKIRPDVVTAGTYPPVLAAWVASFAAKLVGARFIYHMQDIHPEVSQFSGGLLGKGLSKKLLLWLDAQTMCRTSAVVVLSEDMEATLCARNIKLPPVYIINNPAITTEESVEQPPEDYRKEKGKFRVIFAGNLGKFQNLSLLVDGVAECFEEFPELELVFLGDGVMKSELQSRWEKHTQVKFYPYLPYSQAKVLMQESDVGLVSLQENIYKVSYPSKVTTYLSLGLKILAIVEPCSRLAKDTETNSLGRVPGDLCSSSIALALKDMLQSREKSNCVRQWYEENCSHDVNLGSWLSLLTISEKV